MAMRQFIPHLPLEHVGSDAGQPIPVFPVAPEIRFKSGADLKPLVDEMLMNGRSTVNAAACAGKSIKMPSETVMAGAKLFAHIVPNINLAWATYSYVTTLYQGKADINFVSDFTPDGFPDSGLVITSSSVFVMYSAYWRKHDIDKGVLAYMDEAQETDCATHVVRTLQTALPGVSQFVQASATLGNDASEYRKVVTPGQTRQFTYSWTDPAQWDLYCPKSPWCVRKTTGDILIFDDDRQHHQTLKEKFEDVGISTVLLTVDMPLESFKLSWKTIVGRPKGAPVISIIADSGYRSGFTFTTVTRIIDTCIVMFKRAESNAVKLHTRRAYAWEIYQAGARGGRIVGISCDYWRPEYEPESVSAMLEGIESDGAAIMFRLLGFRPDKFLSTTPYAHGSRVPRDFTRVLAGKTYVRAYKSDTLWPLSVERTPTPPVSPVTAPSSPTRYSDALLHHKRSFSDSTVDIMSEGRTEEVEVTREEEVTTGGFEASRLTSDWGDVFRNATARIRRGPRETAVEIGKYYELRGLPPGDLSKHGTFQTFQQVENMMGTTSPGRFLKSLTTDMRHEVMRVVLSTYNGAVAVMTAGTSVVRRVMDIPDIHNMYTTAALEDWVRDVQGYCLRGNALAIASLELMNAGMPGACVVIPPLREMEQRTIDKFLSALSMRGEAMPEPQAPLCVADTAFDPGANSGRYTVAVKPNGIRSRIALQIMGGKNPEVNILLQ